jgi:TPP-dependent pyruvate/acetoin dehydrogenase alpha subunit
MAAGQVTPSSAELLRLYADMRLIREVEQRLSVLFGDGEIPFVDRPRSGGGRRRRCVADG